MSVAATALAQDLARILRASPVIGPILGNWHSVDLPDGWLVAGCVAQTVWNDRHGFPPTHGFKDVDLVYFDPDDLSADAEDAHSTRIRTAFPDISVRLDVKNEARVHLWYAQKFGYDIAPYPSVKAAIDTFPTTAGSIGVRPAANANGAGLDIYAPFGLDDLMSGTVRANKKQITREIYEKKVTRWRSHWPELRVVPWD